MLDATGSAPTAPLPSPEDPSRHSRTQHRLFATLCLAQENAEPTPGQAPGATGFMLPVLLSIREG